ncbi:MAG: TatD family hydrolase [Thermoplasmata archaeon]|nr:TatD family hydrolase [Thermoplasmata archaeon]
MPVPTDLPIVDHHCHLSPNGEGVAAARRFKAAGGTHLFLATQSYGAGPPTTLEGYRVQFDTTLQLAERVRREAGVVVHVLLAPFPVDLVSQIATTGPEAALTLHESALDLAGHWVAERKAVGLGEVGWPHFEVAPPIMDVAMRAFSHALAVARDADCPALVHSQDLATEGYAQLSERGRLAGLSIQHLLKHYARTPVAETGRHGIGASYVATRELVASALPQSGPWFLETDFLDDPRRPGAVLDLATVPRRARALAEREPDKMDRLRIPFVESIRSAYGFTPSVEEVPRS